jgi:hypothetical protein
MLSGQLTTHCESGITLPRTGPASVRAGSLSRDMGDHGAAAARFASQELRRSPDEADGERGGLGTCSWRSHVAESVPSRERQHCTSSRGRARDVLFRRSAAGRSEVEVQHA